MEFTLQPLPTRQISNLIVLFEGAYTLNPGLYSVHVSLRGLMIAVIVVFGPLPRYRCSIDGAVNELGPRKVEKKKQRCPRV